MNYVERVEVLSSTTNKKYIVDTYGMAHREGYYYFYTPMGVRRIKSDGVQIVYLGKRLCLGAQIAGAVFGACSGVTAGKMTANYIQTNMAIAPNTVVGRSISAVLGAMTGFAVQAATTPVFQEATAKFIDKGAMMLAPNTNSGNNQSELEVVNN